ncbi:Man1-Src1p-C-terminal domain-containing protein [Lipomyces japonicus]|uniref:Man1-Src1p-C-terminal domain-containing protein n=1 Tax=Lipomyces japonicus TaxID=56871 RepID=UPI0034CF38A1
MDDLSYLQPGFDPTNFRVPDLRRVLVFHEVYFPSTAKKAALVDLFNDHIASNAAQLLQDMNGTSFEAVPAIVDANIISSLTQKSSSSPSSSSSPTKKKSTVLKTPKKKSSEAVDTVVVPDEGSPFSSKNPFQTPKSKSSIRKRSSVVKSKKKTLLTPESKPKIGSEPESELELKSESEPESVPDLKFSEEYEAFNPNSFEPDYTIPGNEYVYGEEPAGNKKTDEKGFPVFSFLLWAVSVLGVFYFFFWSKEKFRIGYCDVDGVGTVVDYKNNNPWLAAIQPNCTPCPAHAICGPNFTAKCVQDYVYISHTFSFSGYLPFPPSCVPDTEKLQRVKVLMDEALTVIRRQHALIQCGFVKRQVAEIDDKDPTVSPQQIKASLLKIKAPTLTDEQFDELWDVAYKEILQQDDIYRLENDTKIGSTSTAQFSVICVANRALWAFASQHFQRLFLIASAFISVYYLFRASNAYRERKTVVKSLIRRSFELLEEQQKIADADTSGTQQRYIVMAQLKDTLLRDFDDAAERRHIWDAIQKSVETNTNVRSRQMEIQGEIMRIWEWIRL